MPLILHSKWPWVLKLALGVFAVIIIILIMVVAFHGIGSSRSSKPSTTMPSSWYCRIGGQQSLVPNVTLSVEELVTQWEQSPTWEVCQYWYGRELTDIANMTGEPLALRVKYPASSYNPSGPTVGGLHFNAQPSVFPTREVCFSYELMFDPSFSWIKGGKLPGLWIGHEGASGGCHLDNGSSVRPMWRANGQAEAYVYVPKQLAGYYNLPKTLVNKNGYGDSVWRGLFKLTKGKWHKIKIHVRLNSFTDTTIPNYDGVLRLAIDDQCQSYDQMLWVTDPSLMIAVLMMETFFGGSDDSWSTPIDTWTYMRNFQVETIVNQY